MKISAIIKEKILEDKFFSSELALRFNPPLFQNVVRLYAKREDNKTLKLPEAIAFYKEKGYTEEEIFKKEENQ